MDTYKRVVEPQLDVIVFTIQKAQKEIDDLRMELVRFRLMIYELQKDVNRVLNNIEITI